MNPGKRKQTKRSYIFFTNFGRMVVFTGYFDDLVKKFDRLFHDGEKAVRMTTL